MKGLIFALASMASIAAATQQCETMNLPFKLPAATVTDSWGDAEHQEWLDAKASAYCSKRQKSRWCRCYAAGSFDL